MKKTSPLAERVASRYLEAMSNLRPDDTGVDDVIIWVSAGEFSSKESQHGPRIKVMQGNKLTPEALEKAVSVRLTNPPEVLGKLSGNAKKQIVAFIEANRDTLLSYWNFEIGTPEMVKRLKKI